ncbi:MAG: class I SAM-dependent methyltransferase [Pseudomonadota bacterium]|nr:class I SAM-dependent methyltransferase [Pseudomonadota bacterium]
MTALLAELEEYGEHHDAAVTAHAERMLNITRDTSQFLSAMVHATAAREILEIGTSNGYSTLWLANAVRARGGRVTTIEHSAKKAELARLNFARAGLADCIALQVGDANDLLAARASASADLIFLDASRAHYVAWWLDLRRVLRPGGLLIVDNAVSHAAEMAPLTVLLNADSDFATSLVPVGKGELLATSLRPRT